MDEPQKMAGLTEGRMVHYVMRNGSHRPAIIVQVWNQWEGTSNLQVFTDKHNDAVDENVQWATSVRYDPEKAAETWHWIEPA